MEELEKDLQNTQRTKGMGDDEVSSEEEINLIDYLRVLRKHKYLILLGSVLPALIVGLIIFLGPQNHKVVSAYDVSNWNLNENNYKILLDEFYSTENTNKIRAKFQKYNPEMVNFTVFPPFVELSKEKVTDTTELEQIRQLKALLLNMTIVTRSKDDIPVIASAVRNNLENVIPVYLIEKQLSAAERRYRTKIADIEENRFNLELELNTNKNVLAGLKNIKPEASDQVEGSITLQFNVGDRSEYLPLGYQILAAESKIVELEENIKATEERYSYYKHLLALNGKLLEELEKKRTFNYTIQNFRSFLINLVGNYKDKKLTDYLNSYINKIENKISASVPVTEQPQISAISKGTVKKGAVVFAIALIISVFAAFLLEGLRKGKLGPRRSFIDK